MIWSKSPLLTLCVITHDRYPELNTCLVSLSDDIKNNPSINLELLIIDNSKNKEYNMPLLKSLKSITYNLKVKNIYSQNSSLSHARNLALKKAKGKYVVFIDDDAFIVDGFIKGVKDLVDFEPNFGIAGGPVLTDGYDKPSWMSPSIEYVLPYVNWPGDSIRPLLPTEWVVGANFIVNRKDALLVGGFNEFLGRNGDIALNNEEVDLLLKFSASGKPGYWNPFSKVIHPVKESRLRKDFILKRFSWQAVSDVIMENKPADLSLSKYLNVAMKNKQLVNDFIEFYEKAEKKYTFESRLFLMRAFIKWSLQSGIGEIDNFKMDAILSKVKNRSQNNTIRPLAFLDYEGHQVLLDSFEINPLIKSYCLPNLWIDKLINKENFIEWLISLSQKHSVLIIGNLDLFTDYFSISELDSLFFELQKNSKLFLVIHRLNSVPTLRFFSENSLSFSQISGIISYSKVLKELIQKDLIQSNVMTLPLPPSNKVFPTEILKNPNLSSNGILSFGIYGHLRKEKNIIAQLEVFLKVCEKLNKNLIPQAPTLNILGYGNTSDVKIIKEHIQSFPSKVQERIHMEISVSDRLDQSILSETKTISFLDSVNYLFVLPSSLALSAAASLTLSTYLNAGKVVFVSESMEKSLVENHRKYCNFISSDSEKAASKIVENLENKVDFFFCQENLFQAFQVALDELVNRINE
jgi:glycosyltransferase involved in cell wall biosynthesis